LFENAQQEVCDKSGNDLQRQGVFTTTQWFFDFIKAFEPTPPVFNCPSLFVELCNRKSRKIMPVGQDADQFAICQLITDQAQNNIPIPTGQQDGPIAADRSHPGRQSELRDVVTLQDPILDALLEPDHEMGADIE